MRMTMTHARNAAHRALAAEVLAASGANPAHLADDDRRPRLVYALTVIMAERTKTAGDPLSYAACRRNICRAISIARFGPAAVRPMSDRDQGRKKSPLEKHLVVIRCGPNEWPIILGAKTTPESKGDLLLKQAREAGA